MTTLSKATATALAAALLLLFAASSAAAFGPDGAQDARWLAWYGCWEAADGAEGEPSDLLVCFTPLDEGVEIRTWVEGEEVGVEHMFADGRPSAIAEGGCVGERSAAWSEDGARVFVRSEMHCGEGVTRATRGVMAMTPDAPGWLEIHAVRAGGQESVLGVQRFVPATPETLEAQGVEAPARDRELAVRTARAAATAPIDLDDVLEVVEGADADVARTLVAELGQPFDLDARALRGIRDRGMPADVIDVLVAVTYPERFEIAGASREAEQAAPVPSTRQERPVAPWGYGPRPFTRYRLSWYSSPFAWSPWGYDPYWYGAWGPRRVIVVQPTVRDRQARVSPLSGYLSDRGTNRSATSRGSAGAQGRAAPTRNALPTRTGVRSTGASSSGSSGAATTTRRGSGDQSGSSGRRATRRGGGGGG